MKKIAAFNMTVRGAAHIERGLPCEDASGSVITKDGGICVASDGHGNAASFRSAFGAQKAVSIAIRHLAACLESGDADVQAVAENIVREWNWAVLENLKENPPSKEEIRIHRENNHGEFDPAYIYGTTLVAAMWTKDSLYLIQQGDGLGCVFLENGEMLCPVPQDERCHGLITTSLCDSDAAESIRTVKVSLEERKVKACLVCTDGVCDTFLGAEGMKAFGEEILREFSEKSEKSFQADFREKLSDLSARGRGGCPGIGDDVSVAGMKK